jgi:hypothetical protein
MHLLLLMMIHLLQPALAGGHQLLPIIYRSAHEING